MSGASYVRQVLLQADVLRKDMEIMSRRVGRWQGECLKVGRELRGMSQREVGAVLGVSHVFVHEVETGAKPMPIERFFPWLDVVFPEAPTPKKTRAKKGRAA